MSATGGDCQAIVRRALQWEEENRTARRAICRCGLDDPIEPSTPRVDDDDPIVSDLPCDPRSLGKALVGIPEFREGERDLVMDLCSTRVAAAQAGGRTSLRELPSHLDPHDLSQTGWGLITPQGLREVYVKELEPLLELRRAQAGNRYDDRISYRPGDSAAEFLWSRPGGAPGVVDPDGLPYYLLIAGGPELVPFEVQYALSIHHAVGRIAFDETREEGLGAYRRWAEAVVAAEARASRREQRATILAVEDGGRATRTLTTHLAEPIRQRLDDFMADWPSSRAWELEVMRGRAATKKGFQSALADERGAGLALIAAHGLYLDKDNPYQRQLQGAICCAPAGAKAADRFLHAGDIQLGSAVSRGLVAFLFACYGGGTPVEDGFPQHTENGLEIAPGAAPSYLAEAPFVAALPQALLREGALAVVAHVDRGWTLSFAWTLGGRYTDGVRSLEDSLKRLLAGHRLGHALRPLYRRYTAIAAHLAMPLDRARRGKRFQAADLAIHWTAHHDARNFVILGDPAVYLRGRRPPAELPGELSIRDGELIRQVEARAAAEGRSSREWAQAALAASLASGSADGQSVMRG